jgi:very-short-patch-repair endonuclease
VKANVLTADIGIQSCFPDSVLVRSHSPETERARYLRNNMTKVERFVWSRLRGRKLAGFKFRRQVPLGPYFADFYCPSARLVVEVDGEQHEEETDARKDAWLRTHGYQVLRIPATYAYEHIDDAAETIYQALVSGFEIAVMPVD